MALELKKVNFDGCHECDLEKLQAYLTYPTLRYWHTVFLALETGIPNPRSRKGLMALSLNRSAADRLPRAMAVTVSVAIIAIPTRT